MGLVMLEAASANYNKANFRCKKCWFFGVFKIFGEFIKDGVVFKLHLH